MQVGEIPQNPFHVFCSIIGFLSEFSVCVYHLCLCTSIYADKESAEKERKIREMSSAHESDMQKIEDQLCSTRMELNSVKQESVLILITRHKYIMCYFKYIFFKNIKKNIVIFVQKTCQPLKSNTI